MNHKVDSVVMAMQSYAETRRFIDRGYTDTLAIVSKTRRDSREVYRQISKEQPELLLGYNIFLCACEVRDVQGLKLSNFIYSWDVEKTKDFDKVIDTIHRSMIMYGHGWRLKRWFEE